MAFKPGQEITLPDFLFFARQAAQRGKIRHYEKTDVSTCLRGYAEARGLIARFSEQSVQDALAAAFENVDWDDDDESSDAQRPPEFSDDALASAFALQHEHDLRHVAAWGRWLIHDGMCWRFDETMHAFDLSRDICREAAITCINKCAVKTALASAKTVYAVERLAKADRQLAATVDQWDSDPMLLNTPGGVINLRNGLSRMARPGDYMTKITSVAPGGACPIWERFLARITNGDCDLVKFLQRMVGYSLTGLTTEHALFFLYGTGANGKSVFLTTISDICADYHKTAPIETFTVSTTERHPTDLAGLRGARVVTSVETEEGRRWAEAKIKNLTGGDKISARFMRQDFFEFTPQFKLIIAGNHKPGLRSVDEAIRRRFHLIPFTVTIPEEERDKQLTEKLKAEWPGILAWMIEGCLMWGRDGLSPPHAVVEATTAYLDAEDALANWIADTCVRDHKAWTPLSVLYGSWSLWAERSGEPPGSTKNFGQKLEAHHFTRLRRNNGRGFQGIRLIDNVQY